MPPHITDAFSWHRLVVKRVSRRDVCVASSGALAAPPVHGYAYEMDPWSPLHDVSRDVSRDDSRDDSRVAHDAHDEKLDAEPVGRPLLCVSDIHGDLVALE